MMSRKFLRTSILSTRLSKRQRFVLTAVVLSAGLLLIQFLSFSWRYQSIAALTVLSLVMSRWSLKDGLTPLKRRTVLVLPVFFTAGVGLFYFLLPGGWLAGVPIVLIYGLGMYVLLLTENIFSVAAIRTIQLLRAAHAVGFMLTLLTAFLLFDTVLSFRLYPWLNGALVAVLAFPLFLANFWSVKLDEGIGIKLKIFSASAALVLGELALALAFWPVTVSSGSLFLVTAMYIILGLVQLELEEKLFRRSLNEYLAVGAAVLVIMLITTRWGG